MRGRYFNEFETTLPCPHGYQQTNEKGEREAASTWIKYKEAKYHGRLEICTICKEKRVIENGYPIQQISLF